MIRPDHSSLSLARQCRLLSISRLSYYHKPKGESSENLSLMTEIDRQFLETPFYGVQQMTWHLRALGHVVNVRPGHPHVGWADYYSNASSQVPCVAAREYSVARFSKKLACSTALSMVSSQGSGCSSMR